MKSLRIERAVSLRPSGFIEPSVWAEKYGTDLSTPATHRLAGELAFYSVGNQGSAGPQHFVEDRYVSLQRKKHVEGGKRRCNACLEMLDDSEFYPSLIAEGRSSPCRMCTNVRTRRAHAKLDPSEEVGYQHNRELASKLINISSGARAKREQRIAALEAKYEAAGACGDGEDWPDGE